MLSFAGLPAAFMTLITAQSEPYAKRGIALYKNITLAPHAVSGLCREGVFYKTTIVVPNYASCLSIYD